MIEVGSFETRGDAELARSLLAAAGIPALLVPDSGQYPIDPTAGTRLFVAERDASRAALILEHQGPTDEQ